MHAQRSDGQVGLPEGQLAPPVLPGDVGRSNKYAGLMLGDELDEPLRPPQGQSIPALSDAMISSTNTGSSAPTPTAGSVALSVAA
jgi:hypothetical protein